MLYKVKIKIRVNSAITTTIVEVPAANSVIAKALAEQMYGVGCVLSVIRACLKSFVPTFCKCLTNQEWTFDLIAILSMELGLVWGHHAESCFG